MAYKFSSYKRTSGGFLSTVKELVTLLIVVFLIRTFGFGLYQVPTGSMEVTMLVGERFFADKFTILFSKPARGQIISFNDPLYPYSSNAAMRLFQEYVWGPSNWTKRVIGIPGDIVRGVIEDGKPVVYVNDKKLDEPYVNKYPLIALWSDDPQKLHDAAVDEVQQLIAAHRLDPSQADAFISYIMQHYWMFRPYDPSRSLDEQPFNRILPDRVVRIEQPTESTPGFKITEQGFLLQEPYVPIPGHETAVQKQGNSSWNGTDEFYIELGKNQYWLMGDNRRGSKDCRVFGPIDGRLIHGKILFRIWSSDSAESWWILDLIKHPVDFWKRMRWSRFFQFIH